VVETFDKTSVSQFLLKKLTILSLTTSMSVSSTTRKRCVITNSSRLWTNESNDLI